MNNNDKFLFYLGLAVFVLQLMGGLIQMTFLTGWIYATIWLCLLFIMKSQFVPKKVIILFLCFLFVIFIYLLRGGTYAHWSSGWKILTWSINTLFPFAYTCFLFDRCDKKAVFVTICLLLAILVFYTFTTAKIVSVDANILRLSIHDENMRKPLEKIGLCTYALPHAAPFIVPAIIYAFKQSQKIIYRIVWIIVLLFDFWLIYVGGASSPMVLFIFATLASLLISINRTIQQNIRRLIIVSLLFIPLLNDNVLISILQPLEDITIDTPFYSKVVDIENSILADDTMGDVNNRAEKADATISSIFSNFLIGTTDSSVLGGHNFYLDVFASVGLFSIIFYCFIFSMFSHLRKYLSSASNLYFILCFIIYVMACCMKNIDSFEYYVFVFVLAPAILCFTDRKNNKLLNQNI